MSNSYIKDIRVIPTALNLKHNNSRSLLDLLAQLQTGSVIKGLIVGNTPKGEIIFHSHLGRFAAPNELNLKPGDTITLRLAHEGEKFSGTAVKVNTDNNKSQQPYKIVFVKQDDKRQDNKGQNVKHKSNPNINNKPNTNINRNIVSNNKVPVKEVNMKPPGNLSAKIKGNITYLNLSKVHNPALQQQLSNIKTDSSGVINIPIILKIITGNSKEIPSPYRFVADVNHSSQNKEGTQLIKTDFGIIQTENTKIPIGQRLTLEIVNLNNKVIINKAENFIADFLFNIDKSWGFLKQLPRVSQLSQLNNHNNSTQTNQQTDSKATTYNIQKMSTILQSNKGLEIIKELSKEYQAIKDLFNTNPATQQQIIAQSSDDKWINIIIPFYDKKKEEVVKHKVKIERTTNDSMRFVIEVNVKPLGNITLNGLIKFKGENKIPAHFDLSVITNNSTSKLLQEKVQNMFVSSQEINGLKGKIDFQTKITN
ncbi:MAG: hypothetical protein HRU35_02030 [Rickettsiaceae bacterium]|nr:hypothetical protein [Rickettsiaceae bacterium]